MNLSSAFQWPWVTHFGSVSLSILSCKRGSWVTFLYVKYVCINKCKCLCINKHAKYKKHVNYLLKKKKVTMTNEPVTNGEIQKENIGHWINFLEISSVSLGTLLSIMIFVNIPQSLLKSLLSNLDQPWTFFISKKFSQVFWDTASIPVLTLNFPVLIPTGNSGFSFHLAYIHCPVIWIFLFIPRLCPFFSNKRVCFGFEPSPSSSWISQLNRF